MGDQVDQFVTLCPGAGRVMGGHTIQSKSGWLADSATRRSAVRSEDRVELGTGLDKRTDGGVARPFLVQRLCRTPRVCPTPTPTRKFSPAAPQRQLLRHQGPGLRDLADPEQPSHHDARPGPQPSTW